jgi:Na+-transporting methylmalonyl-CoA/oxaloacetate decarboxylase gamma subunit
MDVTGLLVVLVLVILFVFITATGALRRIAAASENTAADASAAESAGNGHRRRPQ